MQPDTRSTNAHVGFNVAAVMSARSISIDALAASLGMLADELRACLRGDVRLPIDQLCEAADRLGVYVIDLFAGYCSADGYALH
jgi:hypothetical protein